MQSSSSRGPGSGPSPPSTTLSHRTPPGSPIPHSRFPWSLGATFALLAAACVLVAAAPAPPVPEPREFAFIPDFKSTAPPKGDYALHSDAPSAQAHHPAASDYDAHAEAERIRSAFAAVVDPSAPWGNLIDKRESGGWLAHFFGGGEGILSIKLGKNSDGHALNISLPHRPAAFPDWLGPNAQLPIEGVLRPFTSLPPPKGSSSRDEVIATSGSITGPGHSSPDPVIEHKDNDKEAPERACVQPAWPPIRPSYPSSPFTVALIERGGCDFATKVLAAQERGAAAVVVGDSVFHSGETEEEGRQRENLITMYSPEDTTGIIIPSVFVSRASYLTLRDLLVNHTVKGEPGLRVEVGEASDDGSALGSLLTFALLMPSLFLIVTVAMHRVRVARQREANRAPPTVVLSLPERVWAPDIVWEKDDSESDKDEAPPPGDNNSKTKPKSKPKPKKIPEETTTDLSAGSVVLPAAAAAEAGEGTTATAQGDSDASAVTTRSADADDEGETATTAPVDPPRRRGKERRKSKRYYSKDECAICMDNFHKGEIVRILPCGHVFHKDECDEWLLKWRKLCPTCRADVTIPANDLSSSTTITPVVDRTAAPAPDVAGYGATGDAAAGAGVGGGVAARAGARLSSMWGSLRAAVARPTAGAAGVDQGRGERAPLVAHAV